LTCIRGKKEAKKVQANLQVEEICDDKVDIPVCGLEQLEALGNINKSHVRQKLELVREATHFTDAIFRDGSNRSGNIDGSGNDGSNGRNGSNGRDGCGNSGNICNITVLCASSGLVVAVQEDAGLAHVPVADAAAKHEGALLLALSADVAVEGLVNGGMARKGMRLGTLAGVRVRRSWLNRKGINRRRAKVWVVRRKDRRNGATAGKPLEEVHVHLRNAQLDHGMVSVVVAVRLNFLLASVAEVKVVAYHAIEAHAFHGCVAIDFHDHRPAV